MSETTQETLARLEGKMNISEPIKPVVWLLLDLKLPRQPADHPLTAKTAAETLAALKHRDGTPFTEAESELAGDATVADLETVQYLTALGVSAPPFSFGAEATSAEDSSSS